MDFLSILNKARKSKTVIGILVSLLPVLGTTLGFSFSDADGVLVTNLVDQIIQLLGGAFALYGRVVAKKPLV